MRKLVITPVVKAVAAVAENPPVFELHPSPMDIDPAQAKEKQKDSDETDLTSCPSLAPCLPPKPIVRGIILVACAWEGEHLCKEIPLKQLHGRGIKFDVHCLKRDKYMLTTALKKKLCCYNTVVGMGYLRMDALRKRRNPAIVNTMMQYKFLADTATTRQHIVLLDKHEPAFSVEDFYRIAGTYRRNIPTGWGNHVSILTGQHNTSLPRPDELTEHLVKVSWKLRGFGLTHGEASRMLGTSNIPSKTSQTVGLPIFLPKPFPAEAKIVSPLDPLIGQTTSFGTTSVGAEYDNKMLDELFSLLPPEEKAPSATSTVPVTAKKMIPDDDVTMKTN